ncbi:MAG: hypothetical protein WD603_01050 [Patescibacteria group bacterium]
MQRIYDSDVIRSMTMDCKNPLTRTATLAVVLMSIVGLGIWAAASKDADIWGILALSVLVGGLIIAPKYLWALFTYCGLVFTGIAIELQGPYMMTILGLLCIVIAAFTRRWSLPAPNRLRTR